MKLYELRNEDKALEELFLMSTNEETGEIEDVDTLELLQNELIEQIKNKSAGVIKFVKNIDSDVSSIDEEIKRLQALKKIRSTMLDNFKKYVVKNMEYMNLKK